MFTNWSFRVVLPLLSLALLPDTVFAQDIPQLSLQGQVRPRFESRTPVEGEWNSFTSMRVRAALDARLDGALRIFVQLQDVRLFGEETNTLSDYRADNLDLHQGFLELSQVPSLGGVLRVGRQELALGEQRLVGSVNWTQQGRSFDGARYTTPSREGLEVDFFAMKLREETAGTQDWDSSFLGAHGVVPVGERGSLDLYGLLITDSREVNGGEFTFGGLWKGSAGPVDLRFEGSLQTGERAGTSVSAFMFGARAGGRLSESVQATLWYDYLSGDDDPSDEEIGVFNTLFATNHAFYGAYDLFLNIPVHTGGLGLQDAAVKLAFVLSPRTNLRADLHTFRTAQIGDLTTGSLANELDLTLSHQLSNGLTLVSGYSFVQAKDGIKELERLSENGQWIFLMLNAVF
jgi:hypothetical protein